MPDDETFSHCDRCGKEIPKGTAYVCITKNIEQIIHSIGLNEDEVEVIQSDLLITLCGSCGNKFDANTFVKLINLTPGGTLEN